METAIELKVYCKFFLNLTRTLLHCMKPSSWVWSRGSGVQFIWTYLFGFGIWCSGGQQTWMPLQGWSLLEWIQKEVRPEGPMWMHPRKWILRKRRTFTIGMFNVSISTSKVGCRWWGKRSKGESSLLFSRGLTALHHVLNHSSDEYSKLFKWNKI